MGISFMRDSILEFVGVVYYFKGHGGWTGDLPVIDIE